MDEEEEEEEVEKGNESAMRGHGKYNTAHIDTSFSDFSFQITVQVVMKVTLLDVIDLVSVVINLM